MNERKDPIERAIELAVYAPLGIGLYLKEMTPGIVDTVIARGRAEIDRRYDDVSRHVTTARSTGEVTLAFGVPMVRERAQVTLAEARTRAESLLESVGVRDSAPPARAATAATPASFDTPAPSPEPAPSASTNGSSRADDAPPAASNGIAPPSGGLPIPGYDALSASQVVQRLAGLGAEELSAVQAYESAHRNRRTILGKIDQLTA